MSDHTPKLPEGEALQDKSAVSNVESVGDCANQGEENSDHSGSHASDDNKNENKPDTGVRPARRFLTPGLSRYVVNVLGQLNSQRIEGKMCDVRLVLGGEELPAHRCVLVASCPFFAAKLAESDLVSSEGKPQLFNVDIEIPMETFKMIIAYLYGERINISKEDAADLIAACEKMQLKNLVRICEVISSRLDALGGAEVGSGDGLQQTTQLACKEHSHNIQNETVAAKETAQHQDDRYIADGRRVPSGVGTFRFVVHGGNIVHSLHCQLFPPGTHLSAIPNAHTDATIDFVDKSNFKGVKKIFLEAGAKNLEDGDTVEEVVEKLHALVTLTMDKYPNAQVYLSEVCERMKSQNPHFNELANQLNKELADMAKDIGFRVVYHPRILANAADMYASDGVNLSYKRGRRLFVSGVRGAMSLKCRARRLTSAPTHRQLKRTPSHQIYNSGADGVSNMSDHTPKLPEGEALQDKSAASNVESVGDCANQGEENSDHSGSHASDDKNENKPDTSVRPARRFLTPGLSRYVVNILGQLNSQRIEGKMCDVRLVLGGEELPAHRCVLVACPFFAAKLAESDLVASVQKPQLLNVDIGIPMETFKMIIAYLYGERINISKENAADLIAACEKMQLKNLVCICELQQNSGLPAKKTVSWSVTKGVVISPDKTSTEEDHVGVDSLCQALKFDEDDCQNLEEQKDNTSDQSMHNTTVMLSEQLKVLTLTFSLSNSGLL